MEKFRNKLVLLFLVLFTAQSVYASGGKRNGTAGASYLIVPFGTRGIAMSGSVLSESRGLESIFYNPANLSRADFSTNVMLSQMSYIADIGVTYGGISTDIEGFGAIALGIKAFSVGEIDKTTSQNPDGTGATYTPQVMTIGFTYSRLLSDRVSVGLTTNFLYEKMDLVSASGISFDIGISYSNLANLNGLNFGIVLKNLGPQMKYDGTGLNIEAGVPEYNRPDQYYKIEAAAYELPSTLEMGVSYNYTIDNQNAVSVTTAFQNNNFDSDKYRMGAEYSFMKTLFLRGGYAYAPDLNEDENTYGFTAGLGVNYSISGLSMKVDYAYQDVKYFDAVHSFSIAFGF